MSQFEEDITAIIREVRRVVEEKHTGQMQITLHMNQGGIGQISVKIEKSLKNGKKNLHSS
jgi:hypothetical protein